MKKLIFVLAVLLAAVAFACSSEPESTAKEEVVEPTTSSKGTLAEVTEEMIKEEPETSEAVTEAPPGGIFRRLWSDPATP